MTWIVVNDYVPNTPIGERSGHGQIAHDGREDNEWDIKAVHQFHEELEAFHNNDLDPRLTYAQHYDYWAQVVELMGKARHGTLTIGEKGEGKVLRELILELRPRLQTAFGKRPPDLRLYFCEPAAVVRLLLGLSLNVKAADETGLGEQDSHIDGAIARANSWALATACRV